MRRDVTARPPARACASFISAASPGVFMHVSERRRSNTRLVLSGFCGAFLVYNTCRIFTWSNATLIDRRPGPYAACLRMAFLIIIIIFTLGINDPEGFWKKISKMKKMLE